MSRFLEWLPDVQEDVGWIREQVLKVLQRVVRQASKSVFQHVSARYVWLPSYIQVFPHPGLYCTSLSAWLGCNQPGLYNCGHRGAVKVLSGGEMQLVAGSIS